jgi:hypothetical protein
MKGKHFRKALEDRMNGPLKYPCPFPMYDAYLKNALLPAGRQIFGNQVFHFSGLEGVKI